MSRRKPRKTGEPIECRVCGVTRPADQPRPDTWSTHLGWDGELYDLCSDRCRAVNGPA